MILNHDLAFLHEPEAVKRAFVGRAARRILLKPGLRLYKFTGHDVLPTTAGRTYTPWWASLDPLEPRDRGLDGHIQAARQAGLSILDYAREVFAVMLGWNTLGISQNGLCRVVVIRLSQSVYGFGGLAQRQVEAFPAGKLRGAISGGRRPPSFGGGAFQLYVPNLTASHVDPGTTQHLL